MDILIVTVLLLTQVVVLTIVAACIFIGWKVYNKLKADYETKINESDVVITPQENTALTPDLIREWMWGAEK